MRTVFYHFMLVGTFLYGLFFRYPITLFKKGLDKYLFTRKVGKNWGRNLVWASGSKVKVIYENDSEEEIRKITNKPIKYILNTHHHPDHFLGNSAFSSGDIYASEFTKNEIETNGDLYIVNLVNIIHEAMDKTKIKAPNQILTDKSLDFDGYKLKIFYLDGHTSSDIVIYDENTKILYTSDLVFYKRTPSTPHANMDNWIKSLKELEKIDYSILVPGHGISSTTKEPIKENIAYLEYLDNTLKKAAKEGLDIFEILSKPIPKEFKSFTMFEEEFERSVINLYPSYEKDLK